MAVISAIWWVLGWYPIRSVVTGVPLAADEEPDDCVQPAENTTNIRANAISAVAAIFHDFIDTGCEIIHKKVTCLDIFILFLAQYTGKKWT